MLATVGLGGGLLVATAQVAGAEPTLVTFAPKVDYPVDSGGSAVATADVNRDGAADLAVANGSADTVSVLLGNGDGTFAAKHDFATGDAPLSIALGDFNRDGNPDLVTADGLYGGVSVLLGNGDGTFAPRHDSATGINAQSVAVGLLNGDANPDIVVANGDAHTVSVLLGNGDGTFAPKRDLVTTSPKMVTLGEFNGDGITDMAIADNSSNVVVFLGTGNGTFGSGTAYPTDDGPLWVAVADWNRDHVADLAVANISSDTVSVLLGHGNGSFAPKLRTSFPPGTNPYAVGGADFNGDSNLDLVALASGTNRVSVLLGNGDGTFAPRLDFATGNFPTAVTVASLNGDARPDIAVTNSADTASVLLNAGTPTSPGSPLNASAVAGFQKATVTWTAPASDGGLPITGYLITPSIDGMAQPAVRFNSTATKQTVTGLGNGTTYTFTVAAINRVGTGPPSDPTNPVTAQSTIPGAPTIIRNATAGNQSATVNWTAPTTDGGSPILGYAVTAYNGYDPVKVRIFNSTATTQTVTGLTNGVEYRFRVTAYNAIGVGPYSKVTNPVTPAFTPPGAPTSANAIAGDASATVSWTAPGSNGGTPITGYVVTAYVGYAAVKVRIFNSAATTETVTGLTNGTTYRFRVTAYNAIGVGPYSKATNPITPGT